MSFDPHHNVFYFYRGPKAKKKHKDNGRYVDFQLENNTTKALINTLYNSDPNICKDFISHFLNLQMDKDYIKYALQKPTIGTQKIQSKKNKILLGICPQLLFSEEDVDNSEEKNISELDSQNSVPDAWIWDNENVILIESKTRMKFDKEQLSRHEDILSSPTDKKIIFWEDIHSYFKTRIENEENSQDTDKEIFLIKQFVHYLELINLSKFSGWKKEDFEFFYNYDEEEKKRLKEKMQKLIDEIFLEPKLNSILTISRQSKLVETSSNLWYQLDINQEDFFIKKGTPFLNFTLELFPNSFQVTIVFPLFPSIDKLKQILIVKKDQIIESFRKVLVEEINKYSNREFIEERLKGAFYSVEQFPQYKIRIFEHYAFWHTRKWIPKVEITLDQQIMKNNDWYDFLERFINLYHPSTERENNWGAGLHILKEYPRGSELLENPEDLIKDIQKTLFNYYKFVQTFVN